MKVGDKVRVKHGNDKILSDYWVGLEGVIVEKYEKKSVYGVLDVGQWDWVVMFEHERTLPLFESELAIL
jgi:hypothetical protein